MFHTNEKYIILHYKKKLKFLNFYVIFEVKLKPLQLTSSESPKCGLKPI